MNKIKAMFIFEMLGRPKDHLEKALAEFLSTLDKNKGIEVINRKIHPAKDYERDVEGKKEVVKDIFTSFAEVELYADDINVIFSIIFNMLPSHVEIIEPGDLKINNFDLSQSLTDLSVKLHRYDEVAKAAILDRNMLAGRLNEMINRGKKEKNVEKKIEEKD